MSVIDVQDKSGRLQTIVNLKILFLKEIGFFFNRLLQTLLSSLLPVIDPLKVEFFGWTLESFVVIIYSL